jgi:GDP-L-fucose synthase
MQVVGFEGQIVFDSTKPDGTPRKLLDVSAAAAQGWRAKVALSDGIKLAYDDYLKHHAQA